MSDKIALKLQGLLHDQSLFQELFPFDVECQSEVIASVCEKAHRIAFGSKTLLSILSIPNNQSKYDPHYHDAELEFENNIQVTAWDEIGSCLIVGDSGGMLHFVDSKGSLIFSHRVLPKNTKSAFISLYIMNTKKFDHTSHTLVAVMENGFTFGIYNIPLEQILEKASTSGAKGLASILPTLNFFKSTLKIHPICKCVVYNRSTSHETLEDFSLNFAMIDIHKRLHRCILKGVNTTQSAFTECFSPILSSSSACADLAVIATGSRSSNIIIVQEDGSVTMMTADTDSIQASISIRMNNPLTKILSCGSGSPIPAAGVDASWFCVLILSGTSESEQVALCSFGLETDPCGTSKWVQLAVAKCNTSNAQFSKVVRSVGRGNSSGLSSMQLSSASADEKPVLFEISESVWDVAEGLSRGLAAGIQKDVSEEVAVLDVSQLVGIVCRPGLTAAVLDWVWDRMCTLGSCLEVSAVLATLLSVPFPRVPDYSLLSLQAAERAVDGMNATFGDSSRQIVVSELLEFRRYLETAKRMKWIPISTETSSSSTCISDELPAHEHALLETEETLRRRMAAFTAGEGPVGVWMSCAASGQVEDSVSVFRRHIVTTTLEQLHRGLKALPLDTATVALVEWLDCAIVSAFATPSPSSTALAAIVADLCRRVRYCERCQGHPFNAILICTRAVEIEQAAPGSITSYAELSDASTLLTHLQLQASVRRQWNLSCSLQQVESIGLYGLFTSQMWSVDEAKVTVEFHSKLRPVVAKFKGDVNGMLFDWVSETVSSKIVTSDSVAEDDGICTLARLLYGANLISDIELRARAMLLLLQVPAADISRQEGDDQSLRRPNELSKPIDASDEDLGSSVAYQLLQVASELAKLSSGTSSGGALTEAVRLQRLRYLATQYKIGGLDVRDCAHVRSAVHLIAACTRRPTAVQDAIAFASSWASTSVDLSSVLYRAIIQRAMEDAPDLDQPTRAAAVQAALMQVPATILDRVMDDVCSHFAGVIEEARQAARESDCPPGQLSSQDYVTEAQLAGQSAVTALSWYHDGRKGVASTVNVTVGTRTGDFIDQVRLPGTALEASDTFDSSLEQLNSFKTLVALQSSGIYLCLSDLRQTAVSQRVVALLGEALAQSFIASVAVEDPSQPPPVLTPETRRICSLLRVSPLVVSHTVVKTLLAKGFLDAAVAVAKSLSQDVGAVGAVPTVSTGPSFEHSRDIELLAEIPRMLSLAIASQVNPGAATVSSRSHTSSHKLKVGSRNPLHAVLGTFSLSRDLTQSLAIYCPSATLVRLVDSLTCYNVILAVHERLELDDNSSKISAFSTSKPPEQGVPQSAPSAGVSSSQLAAGVLPAIKISGSDFSRDGILLAPQSALPPLLRFAMREVQRRTATKTTPATSSKPALVTNDLDDLVGLLQRSENHMLALRVLLCSWVSSNAKCQALRSSLLALARKVLSYREIDCSLAVACLSAVPYEIMVRELKAAVPSIQSDFSRLRMVAGIGEHLSQLWTQEELLQDFQYLQANARWWQILSSQLGLKIDPRSFQSSVPAQRDACIRAVIPDLIEKSGLNLTLAIEYCEQFDIAPTVACLLYIEKVLLLPPTAPTDKAWELLVQKAAGRVTDEEQLTKCLRGVLTKLHPLDYEKQQFLCQWLIQIISEDAEVMEVSATGDRSIVLNNDDTLSQPLALMSSLSVRVAELETYRRYSDIAGFLSGLVFPAETVNRIPMMDALGDVPSAYRTRLPLWTLLEDPYGVMEPVMAAAPDVAIKLSPLCNALQLSRDEFYARHAMATYVRATALTLKAVNKINYGSAPATILEAGANHPFDQLERALDVIVSDSQRSDVWRWVFERERGHDDSLALRALDHALDCATNDSEDVKSDLKIEQVKLFCETAVRDLTVPTLQTDEEDVWTTQSQLSQLPAHLSPYLSDPPSLLKKVLETSVDIAWNCQLLHLCSSSHDTVSVNDVMTHPVCRAVAAYLHKVHLATKKIVSFALPLTASATSAPTGGSAQVPLLESIRHGLLSKLLADSDAGTASTSGSTRAAAGAMVHPSSKALGGLWSITVASSLQLSSAEIRRREDVFLGFGLAALIKSCEDSSVRLTYANQMEAVARGKGSKTSRKLTARSRLRAAVALSFLGESAGSSSSQSAALTVADSCLGMSLSVVRSYLYCLSELQEIRLPCAEGTLLCVITGSAGPIDAMDKENVAAVCPSESDPALLVRTWLHDEGQHGDVTELCRDLLLAAGVVDDRTIWTLLLEHMERNGLVRAQLNTLVGLRNLPVFPRLLQGDMVRVVLRVVAVTAAEAVEKTEQVLQLIGGGEHHESGTSDSDGLSVSELGDGMSVLEDGVGGSIMGGGSVRGTDTHSLAGKKSRISDEVASASGRSRKVLIVPRCSSRGRGSEREWGDAPEDLVATLRDVTALFGAVLRVMDDIGDSWSGADLDSIWTSSQRLLRLSMSGSRRRSSSIWGQTLDNVLLSNAETCALALLRSGTGSTDSLFFAAVGLVSEVVIAGVENRVVYWRIFTTLLSATHVTASECPPVAMALLDSLCEDEAYGASTDDIDQALVAITEQAAIGWYGDAVNRKGALCLLGWAHSRSDRYQKYQRISSGLSANVASGLQVASEVLGVIQNSRLLSDGHKACFTGDT